MSPTPLKIQEQPQPVSSGVCYADLQDRVGPVAAVALDAEDEIPGPIAARRVDEPPAQEKKKNPRAGGYHGEGRRGEGRGRRGGGGAARTGGGGRRRR